MLSEISIHLQAFKSRTAEYYHCGGVSIRIIIINHFGLLHTNCNPGLYHPPIRTLITLIVEMLSAVRRL